VTDEARRFLALTGYARTQAVARGWSVRLWIEPENRRYGLEPVPGLPSEAGRTVEYQALDGVGLTVDAGQRRPANGRRFCSGPTARSAATVSGI